MGQVNRVGGDRDGKGEGTHTCMYVAGTCNMLSWIFTSSVYTNVHVHAYTCTCTCGDVCG